MCDCCCIFYICVLFAMVLSYFSFCAQTFYYVSIGVQVEEEMLMQKLYELMSAEGLIEKVKFYSLI